MTTYYFKITEEKINEMTIEEYEALERLQDGDLKMYRVRPIMCRFMVNENDVPIDYETALKVTGKFTMKEMKDFAEKFFGSVREKAVPNGTGSPSPSLSEATQVDSRSPAG